MKAFLNGFFGTFGVFGALVILVCAFGRRYLEPFSVIPNSEASKPLASETFKSLAINPSESKSNIKMYGNCFSMKDAEFITITELNANMTVEITNNCQQDFSAFWNVLLRDAKTNELIDTSSIAIIDFPGQSTRNETTMVKRPSKQFNYSIELSSLRPN